MHKILNILKWCEPAARFILLVLTAIWVATTYRQTPLRFSFFLIIVLLLILLDIGRLRFRFIREHPVVFSIFSLVLCMLILSVKRSDTIQIYYFFLLDQIFNIRKGKTPKALVSVHFFGFMAVECYALIVTERKDFGQYARDVLVLLACYTLVLFIFAVIHYFKWEREKLKVLNANLIEYSFQEREYLIAKERSHISQELHDSLGHSLMAVLMNVRYLEAIQGRSQEEKNKQIVEIEELLKECVSSLRGSVYHLKKLDDNVNLREEIKRIIDKFDELNLLKIRLDYTDEVDSTANRVKTVLLTTIREGITNSIRHGDATKIDISIYFVADRVELIIKDNGSGCAAIHKSFGLNGIAERVKETGGEVWFISARNKGFTIKALLPGGVEC